jgi:hypothetical protein
MADILRFVEVNDLLGDVGGVIGDALDRLGDNHQLEAARDGLRTLDHEAGELAVQLAVELVHLPIARNHAARARRVALHEGGDRAPQHLQRHRGHPRQVHVRLELGLGAQLDRPPGDGDGLVADALEVLGDLHPLRDQAELGGERRLRQQVDGGVVDLDLELVEDVVVVDHRLGQRVVALHESAHRAGNRGLGVTGHRQQAVLQPRELLSVVGHRECVGLPQPNRPET